MQPPFPKYTIYCDESSTSEPFTVIGAIIMHKSTAESGELRLDEIIRQRNGSNDCKWEKVKRKTEPLYAHLVDCFFSAVQSGHFHYYALVIENAKMDHKTFNEGDKEIGFNKMLFQLLFQFVRKYGGQPRFYAFLDRRTTVHTPENMRRMLNAKAARDLQITHKPFRACQFRDSEKVRLIQLTDIITGAIAYQTNSRHIADGAAEHKVRIAELVASKAGLTSLARPTPRRTQCFDIWHFDLDRAKGSRAPRR